MAKRPGCRALTWLKQHSSGNREGKLDRFFLSRKCLTTHISPGRPPSDSCKIQSSMSENFSLSRTVHGARSESYRLLTLGIQKVIGLLIVDYCHFLGRRKSVWCRLELRVVKEHLGVVNRIPCFNPPRGIVFLSL